PYTPPISLHDALPILTAIDVDAIQQRLDRPEYSKVLASISDVGFHSAAEILATYAGRASDLRPYFAGAAINDDMNLRLQYLAGRSEEHTSELQSRGHL